MPVSHLTTGVDALWALVLSEMSADGYTYSGSALSKGQILDQIVTDVGGANVSYLTSSKEQMAAAAVNALAPGTASHLTMSYAALLAALVNALQSGPSISLSNSTFTENSAQGTAIGTLSVVGGTGTYTFTLTDSASNKAQVAGTNGVNLQAGSAPASAGSFSITVHADNGAGSVLDRVFLLTATSAATDPSLDFSDPDNSQYIPII